MNETIRMLAERMSLRRYAPQRIAAEHLETIMHSTMRAPTAGNMMLYSVIQVDAHEKKERLSETCNHPFIAQAPLVLLFLADIQRIYDFYRAFGVPQYCQEHGIELKTPQASDLMMSCCDALIAAQTSVIAAESLGIGSCYIGDILGNYEEHQELFQLPAWTFPIALVCYGYYPEDMEKRLNTRFDRRFIWFQNSYKHLTRKEFEDMYGEIMLKFASLLEKKNLNLSQLTYLNFTLGKSAREEQRSVAALLDRWLSSHLP
jgi:nitroreductase